MNKPDLLTHYIVLLDALLDRLVSMCNTSEALNDISYGYTRALVDAGIVTPDDASEICLACLRQKPERKN